MFGVVQYMPQGDFSVPDVTTLNVLEATPLEAWEALMSDPLAILVDVRTAAEWSYIGLPVLDSIGKDVLKVEWMQFPQMTCNENFASELLSQLGDKNPSAIYFLCRSGVRSHHAAKCVLANNAEIGRDVRCFNVLEGFEGDQDDQKHRGTINGWKVRGLPWCQT